MPSPVELARRNIEEKKQRKNAQLGINPPAAVSTPITTTQTSTGGSSGAGVFGGGGSQTTGGASSGTGTGGKGSSSGTPGGFGAGKPPEQLAAEELFLTGQQLVGQGDVDSDSIVQAVLLFGKALVSTEDNKDALAAVESHLASLQAALATQSRSKINRHTPSFGEDIYSHIRSGSLDDDDNSDDDAVRK